MKINGIQMLDGSVVENLTIASGTSFPPAVAAGELFYRTGFGLYVYDGVTWVKSSETPGVNSSMVGEIKLVAFNSVPTGWLACDGAVKAHTAWPQLYSAIGNSYGGDSTTFNLPDLRNRVPMHVGTGDVGTAVTFAGKGGTSATTGSTTFTIDEAHMPRHTHYASGRVMVASDLGMTQTSNSNSYIAMSPKTSGVPVPWIYRPDMGATGLQPIGQGSVSIETQFVGGGNTMTAPTTTDAVVPPYLGMYYIIYAGLPG